MDKTLIWNLSLAISLGMAGAAVHQLSSQQMPKAPPKVG